MPGPSRPRLLLLALAISGCTVLQEPPVGGPLPPRSADPPRSGPPATHAVTTPVPATSASSAPNVTPEATTAPTPSPDIGLLELQTTSCEGGVVLDWSPSTDPAFHHYTALRSPIFEIEPDYPPIAPAVDWGDTYATDRFVTSAVDASIVPSSRRWQYRVMAYDARGRVVGASPVRSAALHEVADLGVLAITAPERGRTRLGWTPYGGFSRCFSSYRILYGTAGTPTEVLTVVSDQAADATETDALHPGTTYRLQVEAVRVTTLGSFVIGRSEVATYTVP